MKKIIVSLLSMVTVLTAAASFVTPASADMSLRSHNFAVISCRNLKDRDNIRGDHLISCKQHIKQNHVTISHTRLFFFSSQSLRNMNFHSNMVRY